jgi:hypothetical protein
MEDNTIMATVRIKTSPKKRPRGQRRAFGSETDINDIILHPVDLKHIVLIDIV